MATSEYTVVLLKDLCILEMQTYKDNLMINTH